MRPFDGTPSLPLSSTASSSLALHPTGLQPSTSAPGYLGRKEINEGGQEGRIEMWKERNEINEEGRREMWKEEGEK